jgi:hypothetical protein
MAARRKKKNIFQTSQSRVTHDNEACAIALSFCYEGYSLPPCAVADPLRRDARDVLGTFAVVYLGVGQWLIVAIAV